jgi:hypothetical protein
MQSNYIKLPVFSHTVGVKKLRNVTETLHPTFRIMAMLMKITWFFFINWMLEPFQYVSFIMNLNRFLRLNLEAVLKLHQNTIN